VSLAEEHLSAALPKQKSEGFAKAISVLRQQDEG
jgi:hypothetical protein